MSTNLDQRPVPRRATVPGRTREQLRSIRSRLTAGSAILMLVLAGLLCLYVPKRVGSAASEALGRRAQGTAALVASMLEPLVGSPDPNAVQRVLEALAADEGLAYAIVLDHGDRMLGAYDAMAADAARFRTGEEGAFEIAGVWRESETIGDTGARLFLGYDLELAKATAAAERGRAFLAALLVLMFGTGGIYVLAGLLTGPLRDIVRTVDRVSAGDLTARTDLRSRDELGWLGRSFDTMIARLEEAYGALQTANRDLEERVAERTRMLRREIDERRRAEDALRDSERRFRSMFESAAIGIALIDRGGTVIEGNASLACLLGMTTCDLRGTAVASLVEDSDYPGWNALFERLRSTREPVQSELRFRSTDGRTVWTRIVVSAVTPGEDEPERAIVMFDDITERKALEEQLRHSQKLEAVGRLAGGIAHDFNNLLTTINGLADVLVNEHAHVPSLRNDLDEIRKAGERAAALTAQLLAFSRKQIVLPEEIDFNAAVLDMKPMLERLVGPDIQLRLELTDELHGLRADPGQIAQVVMNLVVNARDAMPDGGLVLIRTENAVAAGAAAGQPPSIRISVQDTGSGMDAGTRQRIFEPFFTTKDHGKGTGLGLSTVYGIVQQAGGTIDVQSEPGRGSTFTITLPSLGRAPDAAHRSPERAETAGHETILLVEDEDAVRQLVGRILRKTGYTVVECADGWRALEVFNADPGRFDAIVTDVVMPEMNGPELVRRLVRVSPRLRILYMSGYTEDEALHAGLDPMATGFIQKPMSPHSLTRKLREVLDARAVA